MAKVDSREILAQDVPDHLGDRPGQLHAGRSAADDHKGQQPSDAFRVGLVGGLLEAAEQLIAQRDGLRQIFEVKAVPLDLIQAKKVGDRPGRDDQLVVGAAATVGDDQVVFAIDRLGRGELKVKIGLAAQELAHRLGDVRGIELGGGHLIQQRPEAMVVVAVEQQHLDRLLGQLASRLQPAEPRADNHHPWTARRSRGIAIGLDRLINRSSLVFFGGHSIASLA